MPTDIATSLPQLDLRPQSLLTVDTGDPAVNVTALVVHGWTDAPAADLPVLPPLLAVQPA